LSEPDMRESVTAAIWQAINPVNVRIGPPAEMRFAPIGEARAGESVIVTGRDYEEMAESICSELAHCGYLAPSFDRNAVVGRIMRARQMKLNSKWQTYDPRAIPGEIFATLLQAEMLIEPASAPA
jgi:hypothetical protein